MSKPSYLNAALDFDDPEIVDAFDELPFWSAPFGRSLLDKIVYKNNLKVLDIGFGMGFPILDVAGRLGETCQVYGIDPWRAAHERAEKKARIFGINNVEFIKGKSENLPFDDDFFDLIISNNGLNNVEDLSKTLSECYRTSKKHAQLLFTMNLDTTFIEFYDILEAVLRRREMEKSIELMKKQIYSKRKPLAEINDLLQKAGFEIFSMSQDKFSYKFTDGTTALNFHFIRLAFLPSWQALVPDSHLESVFEEVENEMNSVSLHKGFFEMSVPFATFNTQKI